MAESAGMDSWLALADVLFLLTGGVVLGTLAERLRQNAILGYLVAGMVLGPHGLHVIGTKQEVMLLAELGIAFLLFSIGLEFSWSRLRNLGTAGLGGGALQVALTLLLGTLVAWGLGLAPKAAIAMGAILALSSTAYVLRILYGRAEIDSPHGRLAIGVLLFQDIAVVPLVLLVTVLQTCDSAGAVLLGLGRLLLLALLMVAVAWVLFQHAVPRLLGAVVLRRNRELPLLLAVVSGLGAAVGAHALGLSPAIGAFLAGMMLAESPFATQVRADVGALRTVLMMLFFGSVGMLGDVGWIVANIGLVLPFVAVVVVGKTLLTTVALRAFGVPVAAALAAGVSLAQIGEFSFVLADLALGTLLDEATFQLVVSTTIVTFVVTPYLVAGAPRIAAWVLRWIGRPAGAPEPRGGDASEGHALVVGYGPTGQAVARALAARGLEVHVIDLNRTSLAQARAIGYRTHVGDATYPEVLEHASVAGAVAIAVTLPDSRAAQAVVEQARALAPGARVFVRARYHVHGPALVRAGAHVVVDEEEQVGQALADAVVRGLAERRDPTCPEPPG